MGEHGDISEFLRLRSPFLGLLAVHGGGIEPGTEEISRFVAYNCGCSIYIYAGRRATGNLFLHRPSHGLMHQHRPLAKQFLNHVETAISIHGHGRNPNCAYVGGLHQTMVQSFVGIARPVLPQYEWISDPKIIPPGIRGRNPDNIVNLPPAKGMQLELPRELRETRPTSDGKYLEPAGDAMVLSRLLVRFIDLLMEENSQQQALRQPASRNF